MYIIYHRLKAYLGFWSREEEIDIVAQINRKFIPRALSFSERKLFYVTGAKI